jgi:hypothetical protein
MIFLVVYDTKAAKLLDIREYHENSRSQATEDFRAREEALLADLDYIGIGLFEGESRATLERTHSRYFKSLAELGKALSDATKNSA